ncbi:cell wall protein IFF6-like [Ixodes scapularis]
MKSCRFIAGFFVILFLSVDRSSGEGDSSAENNSIDSSDIGKSTEDESASAESNDVSLLQEEEDDESTERNNPALVKYGWRDWRDWRRPERRRPSSTEKCTRAFPKIVRRTVSCRYLCRGWPIRTEEEEDGSLCWARRGYRGYCLKGECQRGVWPGQVTTSTLKTTTTTTTPAPRPKTRPPPTQKVDDGHHRQCDRVEHNPQRGYVLSCRYICKGWPLKIANEVDGTPCARRWMRRLVLNNRYDDHDDHNQDSPNYPKAKNLNHYNCNNITNTHFTGRKYDCHNDFNS